jgi:hypothetical protein
MFKRKDHTTEATMSDTAKVEEAKTDERFRTVTDPKTGEQIKRKDYILKLWVEQKMSRGEIAKHLTEITGKKVPYQIVFAATKEVAGGPDKVAKEAKE